MLNIPNEFTDNAVKLFGEEYQLDILQEECSEVIKAVSKIKRGKDAKSELVEEISHVLMSIEVVAKIYDITQDDIDIEIAKKAKKYNFNL